MNSIYTKVLQYELPLENNLKENRIRSKSYGVNAHNDIEFSLPADIDKYRNPYERNIKGYRVNYLKSEMKEDFSNIDKSIKKKEIPKEKLKKRKIGIFSDFLYF